MKLLANENTIFKLYKIIKESNDKKIILKENSFLGEFLKDDPIIDVILDKTKQNNEIELKNDNKSINTNYQIFINSMEEYEHES